MKYVYNVYKCVFVVYARVCWADRFLISFVFVSFRCDQRRNVQGRWRRCGGGLSAVEVVGKAMQKTWKEKKEYCWTAVVKHFLFDLASYRDEPDRILGLDRRDGNGAARHKGSQAPVLMTGSPRVPRHRSQVRRLAWRIICCRCDYPVVTDCVLPAGGARDNQDLRRCASDRLESRNSFDFFICKHTAGESAGPTMQTLSENTTRKIDKNLKKMLRLTGPALCMRCCSAICERRL